MCLDGISPPSLKYILRWMVQDAFKSEDCNYTENTEGINQIHFLLQNILRGKNQYHET